MRLACAGVLVVFAACAAPFVDVRPPPGPPVEHTATVEHGWEIFPGSDGVKLFGQYWRPTGPARAVLIVQHGLKDHGSRYQPFAQRLVAEGYAVYAADLRGHGRSAGRRVTIDDFDQYLADFDVWVARVRAREPGQRVFLFGHSMGGVIVTLYAITRQPGLGGVITSAPALRVDLWPISVALARFGALLLPNLGALDPPDDQFSSDPVVVAGMAEDPLIYHRGGPAHTGSELIGAAARVWAGVDRLTLPLLLLHGTGDKLTAPLGSRELYERAASTDKTLKLYPGLYHDLVHEPGHAAVFADVVAWLNLHAPAVAVAAPAPPPVTTPAPPPEPAPAPTPGVTP